MQYIVLIVDDSMVARLSIKAALKDSGAALIEAASGEEALALVDKGLRPDFVFLDLTMPGIGGLEALKALRSKILDIRIAVVTADIQPATIVEVRALGAYDVLHKPAEKDSIAAVFSRAMLGGGAP